MHDRSMLAPGSPGLLHLLVVVVAAAVAGTYLAASSRLRGRGDVWSQTRDASFVAGCAIVAAATVPLPVPAFTGHMGVHLGVGMVAPVLLVLARPVTLALRALQPGPVRRALVAVARSSPVAVLTAPPVAAVLDLGGLWLLYRTGLFAAMHHDPLVGAVVHLHVFAAGVLFAYAICQVDPSGIATVSDRGQRSCSSPGRRTRSWPRASTRPHRPVTRSPRRICMPVRW